MQIQKIYISLQPHFMDKFKNYDIVFSGLKEGKHEFQFEIRQAFFELFETEQEFSNPRVEANILMDKHSTFLEFWISTKGWVTLQCDISNDAFDYNVENEMKLLVKFGEEYDDSNEEVITIPSTDYAFNIAQMIYESIILPIPMKKLSPNLKEEDLEIIEQYSPKEQEDSTEDHIDPRWEALKKLKK